MAFVSAQSLVKHCLKLHRSCSVLVSVVILYSELDGTQSSVHAAHKDVSVWSCPCVSALPALSLALCRSLLCSTSIPHADPGAALLLMWVWAAWEHPACAHSVTALQRVVLLSLLTDGGGFSQQLQLRLSLVNDPLPELLCCRQRSGFPLPLGCAGCADHSSASQVASVSPGQRALNSQHLHLLLLAAPPSPF